MAGQRLQLNMDDIALGDIEDFEEYTGLPWESLDDLTDAEKVKKLPAKVFTGLALVMLRQDDPDATFVDARRVKLSQIMESSDDPTVAEPTKLEPLNGGKGRQGKRTTA